jgi:hypothetical protein
MVWLLHVPVL